MKSRLWLVAVLVLAGTFAILAGQADSLGQGKPAVGNIDVTNLYLEIEALQQLADLGLTPAQLNYLAGIAKETAEKPRQRTTPKASAEYRDTLSKLHAALKVNDTDLADDLRDKLDDLGDKEDIVHDDEVILTDAARTKSVEFLRGLRVSQVTAYLSTLDVVDPIENFEDALQDSREMKGSDWTDARDEAAKVIGRVYGGTDAAKSQDYRKKIAGVLDKAHKLKAAEYTAQRDKLLAEVHEIAGTLTPMEMIRHQVTIRLATLLANPRLYAAVELRKANQPK
jgi:hypothetical protein